MPYKVAAGRTLFAQKNYQAKVLDMFGSSIVAFWPQNEAGGTVSRDIGGRGFNGTYTGVTLRAQGVGDGETAASYDGTTSYNNIYSAGLASAFNSTELSLLVWVRVSGAGVWTDATQRWILRFSSDASNSIDMRRDSANNVIDIRYLAGGVTKQAQATIGPSTNYICAGLVVSKSADAMITYINGVKLGATLSALGTWSGSLLSTTTTLGAVSTSAFNVWSGSIGPVLLLNRPATAGEIAAASTL